MLVGLSLLKRRKSLQGVIAVIYEALTRNLVVLFLLLHYRVAVRVIDPRRLELAGPPVGFRVETGP